MEGLLVGGRGRRPGEAFFSPERRVTEALLRLPDGNGGLALVGIIFMEFLS